MCNTKRTCDSTFPSAVQPLRNDRGAVGAPDSACVPRNWACFHFGRCTPRYAISGCAQSAGKVRVKCFSKQPLFPGSNRQHFTLDFLFLRSRVVCDDGDGSQQRLPRSHGEAEKHSAEGGSKVDMLGTKCSLFRWFYCHMSTPGFIFGAHACPCSVVRGNGPPSMLHSHPGSLPDGEGEEQQRTTDYGPGTNPVRQSCGHVFRKRLVFPARFANIAASIF